MLMLESHFPGSEVLNKEEVLDCSPGSRDQGLGIVWMGSVL
jgi:hypothetical protein